MFSNLSIQYHGEDYRLGEKMLHYSIHDERLFIMDYTYYTSEMHFNNLSLQRLSECGRFILNNILLINGVESVKFENNNIYIYLNDLILSSTQFLNNIHFNIFDSNNISNVFNYLHHLRCSELYNSNNIIVQRNIPNWCGKYNFHKLLKIKRTPSIVLLRSDLEAIIPDEIQNMTRYGKKIYNIIKYIPQTIIANIASIFIHNYHILIKIQLSHFDNVNRRMYKTIFIDGLERYFQRYHMQILVGNE